MKIFLFLIQILSLFLGTLSTFAMYEEGLRDASKPLAYRALIYTHLCPSLEKAI